MTTSQILAYALAACALIATIATALVYVIPAVGLAISLALTGTAAGFTLAPALGSTMAYGTAALGAAAVVHLTVNVVTKAQAQPLAWGGPVLALVSGYMVQACEKHVDPQLQLAWLLAPTEI